MGFGDLFSSSLTYVRERLSNLRAVRKEASFKEAILAATGPSSVKDEGIFSTWEEMAKKGDVPILPADYVRSFRATEERPEDWQPQQGNCLASACGYYCRCGGIPSNPLFEDFEVNVPYCAKGRYLCAGLCARHGGTGKRVEQRSIPGPLCSRCDGTGIEKPSQEVLLLRKSARRNRKFFVIPWIDIPDDILMEGSSCWAFKERFLFGWRVDRSEWVSAKTWMQAAAVVKQSRDMSWPHPHLPRQYVNHENWYELAASRTAVNAVMQWWKKERFPNEDIAEDLWWEDYVKPCMGFPSQQIEKRRIKKTYAEAYRMPPLGDPTMWEMCLAGLENLDIYDPDAEVFQDCLSDFDAEFLGQTTGPMLDLIWDQPEKNGPAVATILQARRQLGVTIPLLSKKARCTKQCVVYAPIKELSYDLEHALASLYKAFQPIEAVQLMAHPDQEEREAQVDHLENVQGGTIMSTPSFIQILKDKKKDVRGKEFADGSEGRVKRAQDFVLNKKDVFLPNTLSESLQKKGIVKLFSKETGKLTKIAADLTNQDEVVCYPAKELKSDINGVLTAQVFTILNRPVYDSINKLAEAGWKEAKSIVLNLHMRSYLPVHSPVYAFCAIMWGHAEDATLGALSGSYVYLGDSEATILQLPLLCSSIGKNLSDFDAYRRSLVLTTVFSGPRGIKAGTSMFGITAIEFTEYLPSSHAGITHERDSWEAMLRRHGGMEKQRFVAGFNVVDYIEKGKEAPRQFPDFDLQPVPQHQPVVRTFDDQAGPSVPVQRSVSMRVRTFNAFRGPNIPVNHLGDFRDEALRQSAARNSFSCDPRMADGGDGCNGRSGDVNDFICNTRVTLSKELTQGTILAQLDLMKLFRGTSSHVFNRWLSKGYLDTDIQVVSHLAPNRYSGLALWFVLDAYEKFPSALAKTVESELITCFPSHLQVLTDPTSNVFTLKWDRLVGQSLFIGGDAYARPKLYIVAATSTTLATSTAGSFVVEFFSQGEERVRSLATVPEMTYPLPASALRDLDLFLPPVTMPVGSDKILRFPISFAQRREGTSGYRAYTHAAAILSHFQGIGGILRARVIVTSSQFVTAKLRVCLWNSVPTESTMARIPHIDTEVGTLFELKIQDSFYASSVYGDSGACIYISPLSTAFAPETCASDFELCIHIVGIEPDLPLCRTINYSQRFAWFAISPARNKVEIMRLRIFARSVNIVETKMDVTNYVNPFALMVATTGMHWGSVILHFSWTFLRGKKGADVGGTATIAEGFGPDERLIRGSVQEFGIYETKCSVPLEFGSFAGPVPSRAPAETHCNWVKFETTSADEITSLFVTVEVLPGFKFYGRTSGPFVRSASSSVIK